MKVGKKEVDLKAGTVVFAFGENGSDGSLTAEYDKLSPEMQRHLGLHGMAQKVGDSYAGADTPADAFSFASETYKDLTEDKWATRAASSGPKISALAEAVAQVSGKTLEEATTIIKGLSEEQVKALRANAQVQASMAAINAQKKAKKAAESTGPDLATLLG